MMSSSQAKESTIYSMPLDQDKRVDFYHVHLQNRKCIDESKESFIKTLSKKIPKSSQWINWYLLFCTVEMKEFLYPFKVILIAES